MGNKMLIDAAHPEETRVVVLRGNRIEEFDFEAADRKQLRGNIYLAKVTRVEPSLQAAFVEYGGNRHGFLAFSEIHPDYYQIPVADRQQLLEEEARSAAEDEDEPRHGQNGGHRRSRRHRRNGGSAEKRAYQADESVSSEEEPHAKEADGLSPAEEAGLPEGEPELALEPEAATEAALQEPVAQVTATDVGHEPMVPSEAEADERPETGSDEPVAVEADDAISLQPSPEGLPDDPDADHEGAGHEAGDTHEEDVVEQLGGDALEDVPHRVSRPRRNYKIQEVIKRRQILLVQVAKEERGNKGAALTTYLSLAGRYSVLMPNTARGGGISRKIVDPEDRKRLKAIAQELEVPEGMGIILRTAGAARGMPEVKRDFEYLLRMWETVRETTLQSTAPTLVYEEGSLIKRSIRDLFTKDVDEVVVAGEDAYREAKDFMRLLMPTHVRNVIAWREPQPIFAKAGAEAQLDAMFSNQVVLKSGGYLVINQTEALVAIDVNSGRSTREHNIEDTALRTNLEAADEVARQLRLRDLAGLIVVDFIDMEEGRNDRSVERRLKDALKNDRARIQIGRISHFGLLEMSRQRMRTGVLEGSTVMCPHCAGSGSVRSVSSMALHVLRLLEDTLIRSATHNLIGRTRAEVAIYILNQKRANLLELESRFGVSITILADPAMTGMVYHAIERAGEATPPQRLAFRPGSPDVPRPEEEIEEEGEEALVEESEDSVDDEEATAGSEEHGRPGAPAGEGGRRRRRRRRRRGGREDHDPRVGPSLGESEAPSVDPDLEGAALAADDAGPTIEALTDIEGGFLDPADTPAAEPERHEPLPEAMLDEVAAADPAEATAAAAAPEADEAVAEAPRRRRSTRRSTRAAEPTAVEPEGPPEEAPAPARRSRRPRRAAEPAADATAAAEPTASPDEAVITPPPERVAEPELPLVAAAESEASASEPNVEAPAEPDRPKRSGWWQRAKATFSAGS